MNNLILDRVAVHQNRVDYYFRVTDNLQPYFNKENHMFLEYNYDISDIPVSILTIPIVANVIPLIWMTNATIRIDEIDQSFYECLHRIKGAYQAMFPNMPFKGSIAVNRLVKNVYTPDHEAACLFSGGLDALTTLIRTEHKRPLLITEYGWHDDDIAHSDVWEADKNNAIGFAEEHGLSNILIQSNYGSFMIARNINIDYERKLGDSWWHGLHHGLAIISAAIPMAYKLKIECIYIASSNSPFYPVPCASDPSVDNEITYASGRVCHDGYELTRQDKVKVVVDKYSAEESPVTIRVCFKNEENCNQCEKCLRTIMGIVAEGKNPADYGFYLPDSLSLSQQLRISLDNEVKFFTNTFIIIYWTPIQSRMRDNQNHIPYKDLLAWFLDYDFKVQRKRSLLRYRVTQFFPIMRRKIAHVLS